MFRLLYAYTTYMYVTARAIVEEIGKVCGWGVCRLGIGVGVQSRTTVFLTYYSLIQTFLLWDVGLSLSHKSTMHSVTDRWTDNIMMAIANHTACSTID